MSHYPAGRSMPGDGLEDRLGSGHAAGAELAATQVAFFGVDERQAVVPQWATFRRTAGLAHIWLFIAGARSTGPPNEKGAC